MTSGGELLSDRPATPDTPEAKSYTPGLGLGQGAAVTGTTGAEVDGFLGGRVAGQALAVEQRQHVLLPRLAEGESVLRQVLLQSLVAGEVTAQRQSSAFFSVAGIA
jgi:hypothetical protein